jgi:hypothetical protein
MAESEIIENDQGSCEYFRICGLCKKEIRDGEAAHKIADIWCCSYCFCK